MRSTRSLEPREILVVGTARVRPTRTMNGSVEKSIDTHGWTKYNTTLVESPFGH